MAQIIILPYYCDEEVDRYVSIAHQIQQLGRQEVEIRFLLASSPRTEPSQRLYDAYSKIAPAIRFQCPSQIFGYPQGPTAMFWDCMDYIADHFGEESGFSFWLESDMIPVKPNWAQQLTEAWNGYDSRLLVMGCLIPEVYKYRLLRPPRQMTAQHINGGACFAKDFARRIPREAREGTFDTAIYPYLTEIEGAVESTNLIALSSVSHVKRDIRRSGPVVLHGYFQDKDRFIQESLRGMPDEWREFEEPGMLSRLYDQTVRRLRVGLMRRGRRAFIETLLFKMDLATNKQPR